MSAAKIETEKYIGATLRIKLKDSRVLDGVLTVIDPFGNILLSNGYEYSLDRINPEKLHKREIGLVSVPKESMESISVDKKTHGNIFKAK
ncbi:putative N-terminal acetyltransferase C complex subunit [Suhomyces tanzawaensis NRRL Y-17324]|uniref:Putative N-terminal acetyltransferase C complex subunit n=1 Tax=Suhomyces tanzawaensis NRRL Y-17324 TaxID=984487 RepID=A0A1E4SMW5_9ASCO|nr:putative N-terminal acetyltransferase C complex subunit [Suhomyces tanzawaensis NRRL Y-17324]ODV80836.1 putative N-terminal acetyltransferase C complex subunit [Suhomyces tanzawaensis NRRL Y-17324]